MQQQRITPGAGQESVWDYPRPPQLELTQKLIQVHFNGKVIAETRRAYRVLETSLPPSYYIPPEDVLLTCLTKIARTTFCEWKGTASYFDVTVGDRTAARAAWSYPEPTPAFAAIKNYIAFYPRHMDACYVDGVQARAQGGGFYGGWITPDIVGPFKGEL